jgi:hypothetical protein
VNAPSPLAELAQQATSAQKGALQNHLSQHLRNDPRILRAWNPIGFLERVCNRLIAYNGRMCEAAPKRRRFRFTLRTLFVVVTAMCIVAGWLIPTLSWLSQRNRIAENQLEPYPFYGISSVWIPNAGPGILGLFGEEACRSIELHGHISDDPRLEMAQDGVDYVQRMFPEAKVIGKLYVNDGSMVSTLRPRSDDGPTGVKK